MATTAPTTIPSIAGRLRALERLIGNTPLLAIDYEVRGRKRTVFAKSEQMNLTGSIKDRMALHIIRKAYAESCLHPGDTITEATSGNIGIAFAAVGRALGHPVTIFIPNWMSRENKKYLSTDLLRDEPERSHHRTPEITLTGFRTVRRVRNVCGDAEDCDQWVTIA